MVSFDSEKRKHIMWAIVAIDVFCIVYAFAVTRLLTDSYMVYATPVISYEKHFSAAKMIACILILDFLYVYLEMLDLEEGIIKYVVKTLFLIYCVPMVMSYSLYEHNNFFSFLIFFILYWMILCLASKTIRFEIKTHNKVGLSNILVERILYACSVILIVAYIVHEIPNFSLSISLEDVYEYRSSYKQNANYYTTVIKSAFGLFICPAMIVQSLRSKRKIVSILYIVLQVALFSMAKDKSYLLLLIICLVIGLMPNLKEYDFYLSGAVWISVVFCIIAMAGILSNLLFNIFIRRFYETPAWINYLYFDFFSAHKKIWWRQDTFLIDKLFSPVYQDSVPSLIAKNYFSNLVANPNGGMFAEAYSRCGVFGIIIYPVLFAILLNFLHQRFKNANKEVVYIISIAFSMAVCNDVITSTSFVLSMVILMIYATMFKGDAQNAQVSNSCYQ